MPFATSSFLFLVVRKLLVAMPGAPSSVLVPSSEALVTRRDALVPSSVLGLNRSQVPICAVEELPSMGTRSK